VIAVSVDCKQMGGLLVHCDVLSS